MLRCQTTPSTPLTLSKAIAWQFNPKRTLAKHQKIPVCTRPGEHPVFLDDPTNMRVPFGRKGCRTIPKKTYALQCDVCPPRHTEKDDTSMTLQEQKRRTSQTTEST